MGLISFISLHVMIPSHLITSLQSPRKDLFPEQRRAIEMVSSHLADWENYILDEFDLHELTKQSNCFFTSQSLQTADLPRGDSWQWNQSRSKTKFTVSKELDVSFCKLNTRKSKGSLTRSPPYKVWIFQLAFLQDDFTLYFAWCEKGDKPATSITDKSATGSDAQVIPSSLDITSSVDSIVDSPTYSSSSSPAYSSSSSPASSPTSSPPSSSMSSPSMDASPFGEEFPAPDISPADASFLREFFDFELPPLDVGWN